MEGERTVRVVGRLFYAVATALLVAGCSFESRTDRLADDDDGATSAGLRLEIEEAVAAFFEAYEDGDADSVVTFFTEGAMLMPPGAPTVYGTSDLIGHVRSGMSLGRWEQAAVTDTLVGLGSNAVQVGRWTMRFEPTEGTPAGMAAFEDDGRFLIHWERRTGRWRMAQYIANRAGG